MPAELDKDIRIGLIENYQGHLIVHKDSELEMCFWGINHCNGRVSLDRIPQYLFDALIKYEEERKSGSSF